MEETQPFFRWHLMKAVDAAFVRLVVVDLSLLAEK